TMSTVFQSAASYLSKAPSASNVSNDIKLELYGLFKYVTVSQSPNTSRPSLFDFTGRAKWDAWSQTGKKYGDRKEEAEKRYIEIARSLGWNEDASTSAAQDKARSKGSDVDVDDIDWDVSDEEDDSARGKSGMGAVVSTAGPPAIDGEQSNTIHAFALAGDTEKLQQFLSTRPNLDVDEPDEFGYTALQLACDRGNLAMVKVLLDQGADPTLKDPDDMVPMELAKIAGHEDIVKLLEE
ncbi:hypothetical protein GLOTRDRAFT_17904, partial [Gloeophyllum trabeum ATCC 11539]